MGRVRRYSIARSTLWPLTAVRCVVRVSSTESHLNDGRNHILRWDEWSRRRTRDRARSGRASSRIGRSRLRRCLPNIQEALQEQIRLLLRRERREICHILPPQTFQRIIQRTVYPIHTRPRISKGVGTCEYVGM